MKNKILESTLALVEDQGFQGFTISELAKRGGFAVGTVYHYFKGKDEIIQELYHYVVDMIYQRAKGEDDSSKEFKERFYSLWYSLVELYSGKPAILRFFELYSNSTYYSPDPDFGQNKFYQWLKDFLSEGLALHVLRPINLEMLTVIVMGNLITCSKIKIKHGREFKDKGIELEQMVDIVWEGIKESENRKVQL